MGAIHLTASTFQDFCFASPVAGTPHSIKLHTTNSHLVHAGFQLHQQSGCQKLAWASGLAIAASVSSLRWCYTPTPCTVRMAQGLPRHCGPPPPPSVVECPATTKTNRLGRGARGGGGGCSLQLNIRTDPNEAKLPGEVIIRIGHGTCRNFKLGPSPPLAPMYPSQVAVVFANAAVGVQVQGEATSKAHRDLAEPGFKKTLA